MMFQDSFLLKKSRKGKGVEVNNNNNKQRMRHAELIQEMACPRSKIEWFLYGNVKVNRGFQQQEKNTVTEISRGRDHHSRLFDWVYGLHRRKKHAPKGSFWEGGERIGAKPMSYQNRKIYKKSFICTPPKSYDRK